MKYSTRIESIGPRGVLLLAALLVVVTSLTLLANGEMKAQGGPPELLTAPKLTASTKEGNAVELSWTSVSGAVRYELWTWHGGGWEQLDDGALTGTTYSHTGLSAGTTYYYTVRAVAANGPPGAWSEFVGATASETLPPTSTATPTVTATPTPTVQVNRPSSLPDGGSTNPGNGPAPPGSTNPGNGPAPPGSTDPGNGPAPPGSTDPGNGPAPPGSTDPGNGPAPPGSTVY